MGHGGRTLTTKMEFSAARNNICRRVMETLALMLVLAAIGISAGQLQWELLHEGNTSRVPAPAARRDAAIAYDKSRQQLILFGGQTIISGATAVLGDTWIFSFGLKRWREVNPTISPPARFSFVAGLSGDHFYVSTGEGANRFFLDDIWRFNLRTEQWEELPQQKKPDYYTDQQWNIQSRQALKPEFRYGAAGGIFPNSSRFYVSQGFANIRYANTLTYSLHDGGWFMEYADRCPYGPNYPHARCLHAGVMMSPDELLIYGGCLSGGETGGPCPSGDTWIFNGKTKMWHQMGGCASPRLSASLAMLPSKGGERRAILYGGVEKNSQVLTTVLSPKYQVGVFNPDSREWVLRATEGQIPSKRAAASMATGENGIYMFGGVDIDGGNLNGDLYLLRGNAATADQAPEEASCHPTFFSLITLHGILMALAWGFFLQWGAFIARYLHHKAPLWFYLHVLFQVFGLLIAIAGFVCGILSVRFDHFTFAHAIIGIVTMILGLCQPFNALVRPHAPEPGEEKKIGRLIWEFFHKFFGRGALILGLINVSLGVFMAVSMKLLWALWFAYLGLLVLIHIIAEINHLYGGRRAQPTTTKPTKYHLRDSTNGLFGEKHHGYENSAMESEG